MNIIELHEGKPHQVSIAEVQPEPSKYPFMAGAHAWMLEAMEKGLANGREEGRKLRERTALASTLPRVIRLCCRDGLPGAATTPESEPWTERILTDERRADGFPRRRDQGPTAASLSAPLRATAATATRSPGETASVVVSALSTRASRHAAPSGR